MTVSTGAMPWLALYPPGVAARLQQRHPDMLSLWRRAAAAGGDSPCVFYLAAELSWQQVDLDSDALAAALRAGGLAPGGRVGILLQNDPQWLLALLATWKAGGVAVSLSPMLKGRELRFQLEDAGVEVLVCLDSLYPVAAEAVPGSGVSRVLLTTPGDWAPGVVLPPWVAGPRTGAGVCPVLEPAPGSAPVAAESLPETVAAFRGQRPPPASPGPADPAVLVYTSGTTGPPKGAILSHGGMAYNSQVPAEWFGLTAADPVLGLAPLFHVTGLVLHLGLSWYSGGALVLGHRFQPEEILDSIERHRPAFAIAAITAYIALLNDADLAARDLSSLRVVASGGAPVTLGVVQRFQAVTGLTIRTVYGLTETTSPSHLTPPGTEPPVDQATGALSVGVPVPGALVEVVDAESGLPVPPGELGELVISGPMVVPGYWGRPQESAAAIPGGRLFTGDIGFMNPDGWFFVVDRKKDLIVASGYKVWPREVEEVLFEHPAVREAAVVGEPDPYRGETVVAYVVRNGQAPVGEAELIGFCRERLAAYKYPRRVVFLEEIPKTSSGKVLRRALRGDGQP